MNRILFILAPGLLFLGSCTTDFTTEDSSVVSAAVVSETDRAWWLEWKDARLQSDMEAALRENPGLEAVAHRIGVADAAVERAEASLLPSLNLGFGYQEGRKKEPDFGPFDLAPWEGSGNFSWEIDVSGKLRAARSAAEENRTAAVEDFAAARLLLTTRIAARRVQLYRFSAEASTLGEAVSASRKTLDSLLEQSAAGLVADTVVDRQRAEHERFVREEIDLRRLRDLAAQQLRTLRGGSSPEGIGETEFPTPSRPGSVSLGELIATHPEILAASARVRSAFALEDSARLNLLPSFRIDLAVAGAGESLTGQFLNWMTRVGPSLDIPVYDPARLALVRSRKAQAQVASAEYRETVLRILEELESARINYAAHGARMSAAQREVKALRRSRSDARERFDAGLISQIEYFDTERRWLEAERIVSTIHAAVLLAQIDLVKATGGAALSVK